MSKVTRRDFIKTSAAFAAAPIVLQGCRTPRAPVSTWSRPIGANDDVRVAVVGHRSKGSQHIEQFRDMQGVRVVALCDADRDVLARDAKKLHDAGDKVDTYVDVRELLDRDDIDAVVTATPNHWHALVSVWACQAGKDVYVEKPVSHNVWEGRQIINAARRYNRIVQTGTQKRSDPGVQEAVAYIRAGNLGRITLARGLCYKRRASIGKVPYAQEPPASVDYNLWTGPAPLVPLMRESLHYDWHWVWATGCGDLGNQGIHEMDICRWFAGARRLSPRVIGVGGRFGYDDDGETPNTAFIFHDYDDVPILFEVRGLPEATGKEQMPNYRDIRIGNVIHCEGGYWAGSWVYDNDGKKIKQFKRDGGAGHGANFIKAVRSRKKSDLNADILEGHLSSALCHTGNISLRIGAETKPEEIRETVQAEPQALETYERFKEHLAANGVDLAESRAQLGPWLSMDPETERFTGFGPTTWKANRMLRRKYRKPFVVPEDV